MRRENIEPPYMARIAYYTDADGNVDREALRAADEEATQENTAAARRVVEAAFAAGLAPTVSPPRPSHEHRLTVDELRTALADRDGAEWVVLYNPRTQQRLWTDHLNPAPGHAELVGVWR